MNQADWHKNWIEKNLSGRTCPHCNHLMENHNPSYMPHWNQGISKEISCSDCPRLNGCWGVSVSGWYFKSVGMIKWL